MSTIVYIASVRREPPQAYWASFVDLPGCECSGVDLADLLTAARAALLTRLQALSDAGEAWPAATPIDALVLDAGTMPVPIDVAVDDPPVRVNISLGEQLLQRLDAAAEAHSMTRSGFIAHAVRVRLGERPAAGADFDAVGRRLQDELSALGKRINESIGPESEFNRRMTVLDDYVYDGVRKAADSVSAAMARRRSTNAASDPDGEPATSGPYRAGGDDAAV